MGEKPPCGKWARRGRSSPSQDAARSKKPSPNHLGSGITHRWSSGDAILPYPSLLSHCRLTFQITHPENGAPQENYRHVGAPLMSVSPTSSPSNPPTLPLERLPSKMTCLLELPLFPPFPFVPFLLFHPLRATFMTSYPLLYPPAK